MFKKSLILFLFAVTLYSLAGCTPSGTDKYKSAENSYEICFPENSQIEQEEENKIKFPFGEEDGIYFSIEENNVSEGIEFNDIKENFLEEIRQSNYELNGAKESNILEYDTNEIYYSNDTTKFLSFIILNDEKEYILTYSAPNDLYSAYKSKFFELAKTFKAK